MRRFRASSATILPPLLRRFRALHPEVKLVALETDDRKVEAWLDAGSIDLGVVLNPPEASDAVVIGEDAWVAVLPAAHRLARRAAVTLAELSTEPFVLATGGCHVHARTLVEVEGLSLTDVRMEVRDWTSAVALVREDAGIALGAGIDAAGNAQGISDRPLHPPLSRRFGLRATSGRPTSRGAALFMELAGRWTENRDRRTMDRGGQTIVSVSA